MWVGVGWGYVLEAYRGLGRYTRKRLLVRGGAPCVCRRLVCLGWARKSCLSDFL